MTVRSCVRDTLPIEADKVLSCASNAAISRCVQTLCSSDLNPDLTRRAGQALNHAMQDVCNLVRELSQTTTAKSDSIQAYSDEVAKRGAEEATLSRDNAYMTLSYDDFTNSP